MAKKIGGTILLPSVVFIIMFIMCRAAGKNYYGTWKMWMTLLPDIALSMSCAFGIGLQFKAGRFDFSGGAIMLLSAIVAGNTAVKAGNNIVLMVVLSMVLCIALSLLVSLLYVYGRLPVIIATIGAALLYESVTCLIFRGGGINIVANMTLNRLSYFPGALVPGALAALLYIFYTYKTTTGRQAELLADNQQSAVNIGIDEKKNVIISYVFSGVIFGLATLIYVGDGIHSASYSSLSTASELFSNILPVFIGLMLAKYCGDAIGIIMGSLTLCLLSYGLKAVFSSQMGSAITTIVTGIFILLLNVFSAQGQTLIRAMLRTFKGGERRG